MADPASRRILAIHNRYQWRGGEETVFEAETALLRAAGHVVETLEPSNHDIAGLVAKAATAAGTIYSRAGRRATAAAIAAFRPDIVHVHNFFPRLSPSLFDACHEANVPAVWTLHNFRVTCAGGQLFRDGAPCELCVTGSAAWGLAHRCYRGSAVGSAAIAGMIGFHRMRGTWRRRVARFIALSDFARGRLIAAGVPGERIVVKPNFIADPVGPHLPLDAPRAGALYVGRLSVEKGVHTLIEAWRQVDAPLTIVGAGPDQDTMRAAAPGNVRFAGQRDNHEIAGLMARAALVIVPSINYENFPMTIVEAMATATPVLVSRLGSLESIVRDGDTGRFFAPGDAPDLARAARVLLADPVELRRLGENARRFYESDLSAAAALARLEAIYRDVLPRPGAAAHRRGRETTCP